MFGAASACPASGSLALASTATFEVDGTLNLGGGTLDVKAGTGFGNVYLNGGTLENGFIKPDGGTLNLYYATFDAMSYSGTLNVQSSYGSILYIENGLSATGGVINLVSPIYNYDQLEFLDTETFDTQTIQTGGTSGYSNYIIDNAGTLTLGQHAVIAQGTSAAGGTYLQGNFVNRGLISAASSEIYIYNGNFTNAATGTIAMAAGTTLEVTSETSFVNAGLISIGSNGTFDLGATGFSNSGFIFLGAGSTFDLQSSFGLASFPSLSLSSTATFEVDGTLDLGGGTLDVAAGTEFGNVYVYGGTLANGFIKPDGGTLNLANATFDAISYSGTLNVGSILYIENGITATGGVINLVSPIYYFSNNLDFLDTETFDTQTIQTGGTSGNSNYIIDNAGTLTLGQHAVIAQGTSAAGGTYLQGNFVNRGLISAASSEIYIYNGNFTNAATGTIAMAAGTTLEVTSETSFVNAGLISIGSNGTFDLGATGFSNSGLIFLGAGSTFDLQSSFGLASFPSLSLSSTATFEVDGTLDLGGGTLDVAAGTEFGNVYVNGGTLENGFVAASDGGTLTLNGATLSDVTYSGTLNVSGYYGDILYVENGLTATGGVINLNDPSYGQQELIFLDSETLNNQTIVLSQGNTSYGYNAIYDQYGTLTLGAQSEILQAATTTYGSEIYGNAINDGLISIAAGVFTIASTFVNAASGTIVVGNGADINFSAQSFDNAGLITVASGYLEFVGTLATNASTGTIVLSGGGQLSDVSGNTFDNLGLIDLKASSATINPTRFVNQPGNTLTGGTYEVESGSTLVLPHIVTTDAADIILSGTSSTVLGNTTTLEHSLTSVTSAGILQVLGGRNYVSTGTLTDAGQIVLGGGSFSAAALTIAAGGAVSGTGTLGGALTNNGLITAAGGNLRLNSLVTGTGSLGINAGATLELAAGTAETVTFGTPTSLHSTLKLDAPAAFTGTLAGLALGDVIDIGGSTVAATSFSGTSLFITLSSGTTLSEKLGAALPANERFGITTDGGSGSDLTLYQEASASLAPTTLAFGQAHVGATVASNLTIANTQTPNGFTEGLDASFSSAGPGITSSGSVTTLAAGATNSTALQITLSTTAAGSFSSSAVVTLASDGAGTDGQSPLSLGSQTVAVSGAVFNYATASAVAPASIAFSENHVGAVETQTLTIGNLAAPGAYSENLDASFSGTSSDLNTTGSVSELAAGATSTALSVTLNAATAGSFIGVTTLGLTSDGAGIDTLGTTALPNQTVTVTGELFNLATASAVAPTPISFGQAHVGSTLSQLLTISNGAAAGAYSENLDASFSGTTGSLTDSGAVSELAAGATSGSALAVSLNSGTAGVQSGTATLALTSDGSTIDTLGTTALAPETVSASGTLFNYATASTVAPVNFGIVHVGQAGVSQVVVLNNTAASGAYSENLDGSFSGTSASLTATGSVSELAAGSGSGSALNIGLQTGKSGIFSGFTTLNVTSDGSGIDTLGTTALAPETIAITGTVDAYATVGVSLVSGPGKLSSGAGGVLTLNLGSVALGSTAPAESVAILNAAKGQADLLKGSLALSGTTSAFTETGGTSFSGIAAGSASTGHTISLHTGAVGTFTETIVLSPTGYNASGYAGTLAPDTLVVTGTVTAAAAVSPIGGSPAVMSFATPASTPGTLAAPNAPLTGGAAWLSVPDLRSPATEIFSYPTIASPASTGVVTSLLSTTSLSGFVLPLSLASASLLSHEASSPHAMLWAGT